MKDQKRTFATSVFGVTAIALFLVLLLFRLDIFGKISHRDRSPASRDSLFSEDVWMEIRQKESRIGYVHRRKNSSPEGRNFSEDIFMRINTMGVVQPVMVKTSANFKPGGEIRDFKFSIASNLFPFNAEGTAQGGKMTVRIGNEFKVIDLPLNVYLSGDMTGSAVLAGLAPGQKNI